MHLMHPLEETDAAWEEFVEVATEVVKAASKAFEAASKDFEAAWEE